MMATVSHVTSCLGLRKFQADGFLLTRVYRRFGGPKGRSLQVRKFSSPPGFDPRTVQHVASRYTDYSIPAHLAQYCLLSNRGNNATIKQAL